MQEVLIADRNNLHELKSKRFGIVHDKIDEVDYEESEGS